jgi:hypothetical protein
MDLLPFHSICAACCSRDASFRFCTDRCEPAGIGKYEAANAIGHVEQPHLHRICKSCGYEWVEQCLGIATGQASHD